MVKKNTQNANSTTETIKSTVTRRLAWVLGIISFLLYFNTLNNGYVLDDLAVIKENAYVAQGVTAIPKLLTTPYLKGFKRATDTAASNDLYRPLSLVMFAVEHQVSDGTPGISHLVNVLVFAACVMLLFIFLDRVFERKRTAVAFIAALLFALHPIHTEVVVNIKSRDELLCFLFAFASLITYLSYAALGKTKHLVVGALLYFLSLLSKETSASFIAVIPLVFFFYANSDKRRSLYITGASVASFLIYLAARYAVLIHYNANHAHIIDLMENELIGAPTFSSRIATAILVMGHYIRLLFVPYPLCSDYAYNSIPFVTFGNVWVWLTIAMYAALKVTGIIRLIRKPKDPYAFGIWFFLITIALFSNILFLTGAVLAERFLFFASAGFCVIIAMLAVSWTGLPQNEVKPVLSTGKFWLLVVPVSVIFAVLTFQRNAEWKDNYTLFQADVKKYPANARLWYSLGFERSKTIFDQAEDNNTKADLLSQSIADLQKSISIYPNYAMSHNDLAELFTRATAYDSAEVHFKRSIELNSKDPINYSDLGGMYFTRGNYRQAAVYCTQALQLEPRNTAILNNLGLCYLMLHSNDTALFYAQKALDMQPGNSMAMETIATAKKK